MASLAFIAFSMAQFGPVEVIAARSCCLQSAAAAWMALRGQNQ
jgi:hypothetical protein